MPPQILENLPLSQPKQLLIQSNAKCLENSVYNACGFAEHLIFVWLDSPESVWIKV